MTQPTPGASPESGRANTVRLNTDSTPAVTNGRGNGAWWSATVWYALLIIVLFAPVLRDMFKEYAADESMGHGFFVPLVAGYIVWQRREELQKQTPQPFWPGWLLTVAGFLLLMLGTFAAEFSIMRMGLLATIYGVVLATCGVRLTRMLAFPLLLLVFMVRIPQFIYGQITFPLQILASQFAEVSLSAINIPVLREGNVLELASQKLNVVEACSGIRSLLSLTFLSLVYGYFFESKTWIRAVLFFATIPIAIVANGMRVTITGILSEINTAYAEGVFHTMEGWVIFMIALTALVALHQLLGWIVRLKTRREARRNA